MLLLIDIGNTSTVAVLSDGRDLLASQRVKTWGRGETVDAALSAADYYQAAFEDFFAENCVTADSFTGAAMTSVVPVAAGGAAEALARMGISGLLTVDCHTDTGIALAVDAPETVGTDMIVGAAAAVHLCGAPVIMIDMGTATTFSLVDEDMNYRGHIIAAGIGISLGALKERTAQLPLVEPGLPPQLIGTNTVNAMKSGAMYGAAAMIDGIIDRIFEEYGREMPVIATGGYTEYVLPLCRHRVAREDQLLLKGLLYIKNRV